MSAGFPDDPGFMSPELDLVIRALTAPGHPHEKAGRETALAAFRAAQAPPRRRPARLRLRVPVRLGAVIATGATALAAFTIAAYAQALPAPVQQFASSILSPIGVPGDSGPPPSVTGNASPSPTGGGTAPSGVRPTLASTSPAAKHKPPAKRHRKRPVAHYHVGIVADRSQVAFGGRDRFTAIVRYGGRLTANMHVTLEERLAGTTTWLRVGYGVTGPYGHVNILVTGLTQTAIFRFTGPKGTVSASVTVTVTRPKLRPSSSPSSAPSVTPSPSPTPSPQPPASGLAVSRLSGRSLATR